MNEKFDPAPFDKYAEDPATSLKRDLITTKLDEAVMETFPASDPVSFAVPAPGDIAEGGTPGTGDAVCPECQGTGQVDERPCENCSGSGKGVGGPA